MVNVWARRSSSNQSISNVWNAIKCMKKKNITSPLNVKIHTNSRALIHRTNEENATIPMNTCMPIIGNDNPSESANSPKSIVSYTLYLDNRYIHRNMKNKLAQLIEIAVIFECFLSSVLPCSCIRCRAVDFAYRHGWECAWVCFFVLFVYFPRFFLLLSQ